MEHSIYITGEMSAEAKSSAAEEGGSMCVSFSRGCTPPGPISCSEDCHRPWASEEVCGPLMGGEEVAGRGGGSREPKPASRGWAMGSAVLTSPGPTAGQPGLTSCVLPQAMWLWAGCSVPLGLGIVLGKMGKVNRSSVGLCLRLRPSSAQPLRSDPGLSSWTGHCASYFWLPHLPWVSFISDGQKNDRNVPTRGKVIGYQLRHGHSVLIKY